MKNKWTKPSEVIFFGCGGHARSVADIFINISKKNKIIFIDENARKDEKIFGFPVLKELNLNYQNKKCFFAIGDNLKRKIFFEKISERYAFEIISIISKNSYQSFSAKIFEGCFLGYNSFIGPDTVIGKNTIINNGAVIEHEVSVGEFLIAPNTISGRSKIGNLVFRGVGATIVDKISICSSVIIVQVLLLSITLLKVVLCRNPEKTFPVL